MKLYFPQIFEDKTKSKKRNGSFFNAEGKAKKAYNPGSNSGTNISTKNNSNCLCKINQLCINKTYHHYGSCSRRLNYGCNTNACKYCIKSVAGYFSQ